MNADQTNKRKPKFSTDAKSLALTLGGAAVVSIGGLAEGKTGIELAIQLIYVLGFALMVKGILGDDFS